MVALVVNGKKKKAKKKTAFEVGEYTWTSAAPSTKLVYKGKISVSQGLSQRKKQNWWLDFLDWAFGV